VTTEERERIEARLEVRLGELTRTRLAMLRSAAGMRDSELADVDQHPADRAGELYDVELEETERAVLEEEERRIAEARRALAEGTYGICRDCGREIPADRLEAMPEAVRCLDCQRHFEGHNRQRAPVS
jgi:phage/conjugal plasmid C-4 type zinc finger TraR family protein